MLLLFLAAGRGLVELLPAFRERPRAARLGWSYLFGVASVAGAAYVMGAVFDVQIRRSVVLAPVVLLVLGGLASRVVRGRRAGLIKLLWHDGIGLCLLSKRLEQGGLIWPSVTSTGRITLSPAQLAALLDGCEWRAPVVRRRPALAG